MAHLPRIDVESESTRLDCSIVNMRREVDHIRRRLETIDHVEMLISQFEKDEVTADLAMRWLNKLTSSGKNSK